MTPTHAIQSYHGKTSAQTTYASEGDAWAAYREMISIVSHATHGPPTVLVLSEGILPKGRIVARFERR